MRRELSRNGQLRWLCGLEGSGVPSAYVYSRFMKKKFDYEKEMEDIFQTLVRQLSEVLPDLGKLLAIDNKAIHSGVRTKS